MSFSSAKTTWTVFTKSTKLRGKLRNQIVYQQTWPALKIGLNAINYVNTFRMLGVYFDDGLTWRHHIRYSRNYILPIYEFKCIEAHIINTFIISRFSILSSTLAKKIFFTFNRLYKDSFKAIRVLISLKLMLLWAIKVVYIKITKANKVFPY